MCVHQIDRLYVAIHLGRSQFLRARNVNLCFAMKMRLGLTTGARKKSFCIKSSGTIRFVGRPAIVTGAASGIVRAVAIHLAAEGARVTLCDINPGALDSAVALIGNVAHAIAFDVGDSAACGRAVVKAANRFGGIDILCNIAGVLDFGAAVDIDDARWLRTININLNAVFFMSRAAIPHLIKARGSIVNMASAAGLVGVPFNHPYTASKHAVVGLAKSLALEPSTRGVRVNAVCPGGVNTPMIAGAAPDGVHWEMVARTSSWLDGGAMCEAEDIASAVAFLASTDANRVTGTTLEGDGGHTAA